MTRTTENPEPRTKAGRDLLRLGQQNAWPFDYPERILAIEAEAAQGAAPRPWNPTSPNHDCVMPSSCGVTGFYCYNSREGSAPREHRRQSINGCVTCHKPWHEHSTEEQRAAPRAEELDVERLQRCPSLMALLNRYGKFNGAWWDRLADEYTRLSGPSPSRSDE